jgi:hypothetical protein
VLILHLQGTTFSGVAFAFATNNEAKEDIITEWPGAGSYAKQKVCFCSQTAMHQRRESSSQCLRLGTNTATVDSNRPLLRSVPESGRMGSRYC